MNSTSLLLLFNTEMIPVVWTEYNDLYQDPYKCEQGSLYKGNVAQRTWEGFDIKCANISITRGDYESNTNF